jgi:hypothetical protein
LELAKTEKENLEERLHNLEKCKREHEEKLEWNFEIDGLRKKVCTTLLNDSGIAEPPLKSSASSHARPPSAASLMAPRVR